AGRHRGPRAGAPRSWARRVPVARHRGPHRGHRGDAHRRGPAAALAHHAAGRFLMYMDLTVWLRLLGHVHRETHGVGPWLRRMAWFFAGSLYLLLCNLLLLADHLVFSKFRRLAIANGPVFVIGNMRSGTTRMHRLLCDDRRHTTSLALWEIIFPS